MAQLTTGISIDRPGWTGANLDLTVGIFNDVYDLDTELGVDITNHFDVVTDIVAWGNAGARPWAGIPAVFTWEFNNTVGPPQMALRVVCDQLANWIPNAAMIAMTAWPAIVIGGNIMLGTAGVDGTCNALFSVPGWAQAVRDPGIHARDGSCTHDSQSQSLRRTRLEANLTEDQALAMMRATKDGGATRQCRVYHTAVGVWQLVNVGKISTQRGQYEIYSVTIEGSG